MGGKMKDTKYRLKKDTPEFKAGQMFTRGEDEDGNDSLFASGAPLAAFDVSLIDNFDEWFEEVEESGWWKPSRGDSYYFINGAGVITSTVWMDNSQDRVRYLMGNCFRTTEAADRFANYLKAIATVRQDEGVLTPDDVRKTLARDGTVYTIGINCTMLSVERFYNTSAGAVYFDTGYNAKASCEKHPDQWKIIANYDWSRE